MKSEHMRWFVHVMRLADAEDAYEKATSARGRIEAGAEIRHRVRCLRAWEQWDRGEITTKDRGRKVNNSATSRWQDINRTSVHRWLPMADQQECAKVQEQWEQTYRRARVLAGRDE